MAKQSERRLVARLPIPSRFSGPGLEQQAVRLLDLSREGARIEHVHPVPDRKLCDLTLPPALGGVRLHGEVIWSHIAGYKPVVEGKSGLVYQSGLTFRWLTPKQRAGLAAALEILKAAQEPPPPE